MRRVTRISICIFTLCFLQGCWITASFHDDDDDDGHTVVVINNNIRAPAAAGAIGTSIKQPVSYHTDDDPIALSIDDSAINMRDPLFSEQTTSATAMNPEPTTSVVSAIAIGALVLDFTGRRRRRRARIDRVD